MLNMKLEILFFLTLCAIFNNQYNFAKALVGPNVRSAEENEFPFIVSIMRVRNSSELERLHRCTGSLVTKQDVLTAEHCLLNALTAAIKVMVGSSDLALCSPYYTMFFLTYDQWAAQHNIELVYSNNDIGFVKIIGNVPDHISIVPLGNAPSNALYELVVATAGWGRVENNTIPRILQTVILKIITNNECENKIAPYENQRVHIQERLLCTIGDPYALLNKGDSGGPLLFFGTLIAVNHGLCPFIDGRIHREQINIHQNIHNYYNFIQYIITNTNINF